MTTPTPRQRLAEAVKASQSARLAMAQWWASAPVNPTPESLVERAALESAISLADDKTYAAARAMLAAPDDAAELRALRALGRAGYWTGFADDGTVHGGGEVAPTATELCKKLGVPHD